MVKKNDTLVMECLDLTNKGLGVCRADDFVVFVPNLLPGEVACIQIVKVLSKFGYGKVLELRKAHVERVQPICQYYPMCGGCQIHHLSKVGQENFVFEQVRRLLPDMPLLPVIGLENAVRYRNKVMIPVDMNDRKFGYYRLHSHKIVNIESCLLQSELMDSVFLAVRQFILKYNVKTVLNIILRHGYYTNELMVALAVSSQKFNYKKEFCDFLLAQFPMVRSIVLTFNERVSNKVISEQIEVLYGDGYIHERLHGLTYRLSLNSFFQINTLQCEVLYQVVRDFAQLQPTDTLLDLYCGVGSIGLFLAQDCQRVIGVEIVVRAIADAKVNAELNNISNAEFVCADASEFVDGLSEAIDVVVVDPPRKGLTPAGIRDLVRINPHRIVYVSCNPVTLARDLALLKSDYVVEKVQPVDMFGQSSHVETVALLCRKDIDNHIEVKLELNAEDVTKAESKGTYENIKEYVLDKYGFKVSTLYIAQIKRKCGLEPHENYNKSKKEKSKVPKCPKEKEDAIMDALMHFGMIVQEG